MRIARLALSAYHVKARPEQQRKVRKKMSRVEKVNFQIVEAVMRPKACAESSSQAFLMFDALFELTLVDSPPNPRASQSASQSKWSISSPVPCGLSSSQRSSP